MGLHLPGDASNILLTFIELRGRECAGVPNKVSSNCILSFKKKKKGEKKNLHLETNVTDTYLKRNILKSLDNYMTKNTEGKYFEGGPWSIRGVSW